MRKLFGLIIMLAVVAFVPVNAMAADTGEGASGNVLDPSICDDLDADQQAAAGCKQSGQELFGEGGKIPNIVSAILWIAGLLAVGMIIYAAVRMVISQGDPGKLAQEQKTLTYAVVGLIVVLLAYTIVSFIVGAFSGSAPAEGEEEGGDAPTAVIERMEA